ncbi:MAG: acetamidase/formamidase family protein [Gemmatimonadetes bacterium]|nr:acetamidase/formamidase family protein [Gemmatimonadota bacterium]
MPEAQFSLPADNTHARWSRTIEPVLTVPSGSVVEVFTQEATGGQLTLESTVEDVANLDFDLIHALTGPIRVEGAQPGDVLAVTLHEIEVGDWGWAAIAPGFGFLADIFTEPWLKTFELGPDATHADFGNGIRIPIDPFPGVLGVAPDTDELLVTIPPRANGGNMDNRHMKVGTTVYLPVAVEGANFSIGDTHAAQGDGEVSGTAIEAPMRIVLELEVLADFRDIAEPEYETSDFYAVTGFGTDIDQATRKAVLAMIDYLEAEHGMAREDAYVLASLAADLKISETVDMPHYLVSMHMPKAVLPR